MKPRDFCPKWTFPSLFWAHLYIFTKATVCPNAYIAVCLTWKRVFAACLEALFTFFVSMGALLLAQCPSWETYSFSWTVVSNTSSLDLCGLSSLFNSLNKSVWFYSFSFICCLRCLMQFGPPQLSWALWQYPFSLLSMLLTCPSSSHCHMTTGVIFSKCKISLCWFYV